MFSHFHISNPCKLCELSQITKILFLPLEVFFFRSQPKVKCFFTCPNHKRTLLLKHLVDHNYWLHFSLWKKASIAAQVTNPQLRDHLELELTLPKSWTTQNVLSHLSEADEKLHLIMMWGCQQVHLLKPHVC